MISGTVGRAEPYTEDEIGDEPCARCNGLSKFQWTICSLGNRWVSVCPACDVSLNKLVLGWLGVEDVEEVVRAYAGRRS